MHCYCYQILGIEKQTCSRLHLMDILLLQVNWKNEEASEIGDQTENYEGNLMGKQSNNLIQQTLNVNIECKSILVWIGTSTSVPEKRVLKILFFLHIFPFIWTWINESFVTIFTLHTNDATRRGKEGVWVFTHCLIITRFAFDSQCLLTNLDQSISYKDMKDSSPLTFRGYIRGWNILQRRKRRKSHKILHSWWKKLCEEREGEKELVDGKFRLWFSGIKMKKMMEGRKCVPSISIVPMGGEGKEQ